MQKAMSCSSVHIERNSITDTHTNALGIWGLYDGAGNSFRVSMSWMN